MFGSECVCEIKVGSRGGGRGGGWGSSHSHRHTFNHITRVTVNIRDIFSWREF